VIILAKSFEATVLKTVKCKKTRESEFVHALMDCSRLMIFFADKESAFECSAVEYNRVFRGDARVDGCTRGIEGTAVPSTGSAYTTT